MLSSVIISHSKLSCNDESATLDEQAEKILYYYPESTSVAEQLTQIGCLESLVQFSNTFSNKSNNIDYVLLKNSIWGFLECEENLWIYINIKHPSNSGSEVPSKSASTSASQDAFSNHALHIPNGDVLIDIITKLYRMYMTFHGSINSILFSNIGSWNEILRARDLRKRSRKLQYQMDQLDDDLRYLKRLEERKNRPPSVVEPSGTTNDDDDDDILPIRTHSKASDKNETLSYFEGKKSVDMEVELSKVSDAADICRSELVSLLNSGLYSPDIARQSLLTFMRWYLSRGELVNATFLHQCHGMNNTAVSKEMLPHVMRIRNGLVSLSDSIQGTKYSPIYLIYPLII